MPKGRLRKYGEIVGLLMRYGGSDLVRNANHAPELRAHLPPTENQTADPERLAKDLESLGPTFIKLGQLLSTRGDLLPQPYLTALSRLQDEVKPFSFLEVRRVIGQELDRSLSRAYRDFERQPIAAASLAQVHRATLRDGRSVAVKVQRPHIREEIEEDLETLQKIAELLDGHTDVGRKFEFHRTLDEFRKTLLEELDFQQEAQHLLTLRNNLGSFDSIVIPEPIESHTTERVLTMEFVRGTKVTEAAARVSFDGPHLAEQLFNAYLQQILVDGVFHADPHPGNVVVTPEGAIGLLDVGMVGRISPTMREDLLKLLLAASEGEADSAADIAIKVMEAREWFDEAAFRRETANLIMRYRDAALKELPVGRVVVDITRIAVGNGLRVAPELTVVAKTLLNLDEVGRALDPDFDPNYSLRRNAARLIQQRLLQSVSPAHVFSSVLETKDFVQELPARANRILDALAKNDLRFKVELIDEGSVIDGLQKVANRIALGLVLAAMILGAALLMQVPTPFRILGYPGLAILFFVGAAAGGLWLSFTILAKDRPAHRTRT